MYRKIQKLGIFSIISAFFAFSFVLPASAYTGTYGIMPSPAGGPSSVTVTNFKINTRNSNPYTITANLNYVKSIIIETNPLMKSHVLIKEYPPGLGKNFDIIVPQPLQNSLVEATLFVWAPDGTEMVVEHDHKGAPIVYEDATKVLPEQTDGNGNVLWTFTVNSFSTFTFMTSPEDLNRQISFNLFSGTMIAMILGASLIAPLALRRN